ncbi:MAG: extracellular solute-binding protein, partial [Thermotogota bacterium]|nr:extracellular solute-binding protein [Thermotogota bacterium]
MSKKVLVSFVLFVMIFSSMALAVEKVVLTGTFAAPADRWNELIPAALEELNKRHPDMDITMEYEVLPYDDTRSKLITLTAGKTPRDLVSIDQIWLGEFAQSGFLKDITEEVNSWGRIGEFYPANVEGSKFDDKFYSIWAWTDVRVTWYWKDLLEEAGVDPEMLKTWDGYIEAYKKLAPVTMTKGILPMHLVGASHSPDMWFPYLWMNGGEILEQKDGEYYPTFYSEAGVKALTFLRDQVEAGIRPQ